MKRRAASWHRLQKPKRLTSVVMMLIIWAGVAGSLFAAVVTDVSEKNYLKSRANTIAATLPFADLKKLSNAQEDLDSEIYKNTKSSLQRVRGENPDLSFIRIAQMNHGAPVFAVDSEIPYTRDYAAPGHPYPQASNTFLKSFRSSDPIIEGPFKDQWGWWMASYAPVRNPASQEVVGVVGIYTPAVNYYFKLLVYSVIPLLLAAIPLAGLIRDRKLETKEWEITGLKNQFVSIASHELRSPINGMLWAIQSLLRDGDNMNKKQKNLLNDMFHSTQASLATVNEILDLSVFERGENDKLQQETVDMVTVVEEVTKTLKLGAEEKHIKFSYGENWPEHAYISGDVAALKRAFMNLIANAVKYSPPRSHVELNYRRRSGNHIFSITDHGIGIPPKEQEKVLQGYYRATNAIKVQTHGTGLGLWITRLVVEQHGGTIKLHSKVDHGTTMHVQLPVLKSASSVLQPQAAQPKALTT